VHFLCFYNSPACREINAHLAFVITVQQLATTREESIQLKLITRQMQTMIIHVCV